MPIPLTVLAGPSTSLRDDLVRCLVLRRPGLVAVVYDIEPGSTDLTLVRRLLDADGAPHVEQLALTGCCLSCTVREDAAPILSLVAGADRWTEVVLALPACLQPAVMLPELYADLPDSVRLDTVTTVVDALLLREQLGGDDLLADRGLAAAPTDRRSTAELVVGQLEDADVLAVANLHRAPTGAARTLEALLAHLSPLALPVLIGPGGADCEQTVSTGRHDSDSTSAGRERLSVLAAELCPPSCDVATVVWQSERPLHSARLHAALPAMVEGVIRSRGHAWLADRPRQRLRWESAGGSLSLGEPEQWRSLPGCELVLTGVGLDPDGLRAALEQCLATDGELAGPPSWADPFEAMLGPAERPVSR